MAGLLDTIRGMGRTSGAPRNATTELGVGGTYSWSGQIESNERNPRARGTQRWATAQEILTNVSIAAASVRYYLDLLARPNWKLNPPNDSAEAKRMAEFAESLIHSTDTSWTRLARRQGIYKFHGFGFHEWTAKSRDDGLIGFKSIQPRPPHTVERWDLDPHNAVLGFWQKNPKGSPIYIPRPKLVYLVDDALTDSPEGFGWYRHLIEPRDRMTEYLRLEKMGYQRDLGGTPVGRAPYAAIAAAKKAGQITEAEAKALTAGIEEFVRLAAKRPDTSLMLDSQPFQTKGKENEKGFASSLQYGVELLTATATTVKDLGGAIERTAWDIATVIGTQRLLIGRSGEGSRALSEDTSNNLFLSVNSTLSDMAECYDRDLIGPAWAMNGLDPALRPTLEVEDSSFKDVEKIAAVLSEMAAAGAVLAPDDPAINDVRSLCGLPDQPEMTPERMAMLGTQTQTTRTLDNPDPDPTATTQEN